MNLNLNDGQQDPAWLDTLVSSPSRFVPLLLKLAYNACPLKKQKRANCVRARGKKTNQILGPLHAMVLLASGQMSSDDNAHGE